MKSGLEGIEQYLKKIEIRRKFDFTLKEDFETKFKFKMPDEEKVCPICLGSEHEEKQNEQQERSDETTSVWVTHPECGHDYHGKCISDWFRSSMRNYCDTIPSHAAHMITMESLLKKCTCPVCRAGVPSRVLDTLNVDYTPTQRIDTTETTQNNEPSLPNILRPHTIVRIEVNQNPVRQVRTTQERKTYHALLYLMIALPACIAIPLTLGFLIREREN